MTARASEIRSVTRATLIAPVARGRDLFAGAHALRIGRLACGITLHAVNLYIATSILPTVVADIGGMPLHAWNTTVFVVASIVGAAIAVQVLQRAGPRAGYVLTCTSLEAGSALCALAPAMPTMLLGRALQGLGGGLLLALP